MAKLFFLVKHPINNVVANKSILENNDFICDGFFDGTRFWNKAQCLDATNKDVDLSWKVIDRMKNLTIIKNYKFLTSILI